MSLKNWRKFLAMGAGLLLLEPAVVSSLFAVSPFLDPNLSAAVASALGKPPAELSPGDLTNLNCLSANRLLITNLSGLERATNLSALYLTGNVVQDLTPVANLTQLRSLEFNENQVTDLTPLRSLTNLSCLSLGSNPVTNYWVISNLTQLIDLSVRTGTFKELTPLKNLTGLKSLVLWNNNISDTAALSNLTNLARLDLRWNALGSVGAATSLPTNLISLYLGANSLSNSPALGNLRQLTLLNLDDNWIKNLAPLTNLVGLTYLSLNRNPGTNLTVLTNLSSLANIELRGNSLTDIAFLSRLGNLAYADLANNRIQDLSAASRLASLVIGGNALTNPSTLRTMTGVTNLWLFGNGITNGNWLGELSWLRYLNAENTGLTNLPPLSNLTNLTGLALGGNPIADFSAVGQLTNLRSLRLEKSLLKDCKFLTNLTALTFLSLNQNQLSDLTPLGNLTEIRDLYLRRNQLHQLDSLLSLSKLATVDVSLNLTNLDAETGALSTIRSLQGQGTSGFDCGCTPSTNTAVAQQCQRVKVIYTPTSQPPSIATLQRWFIPCNATSSLPVQVFEYPSQDVAISVTASSTNPALVSVLTAPLPGKTGQGNLSVISGCDAVNNTTSIALAATDDAGLSTTAVIRVTVVPNLSLSTVCPNADSNLVNAIAATVAKTPPEATVVDLLSMNQLSAGGLAAGEVCLWAWLTNLTRLYLSGPKLTSVDFLTNLTQLTDFSVEGSSISNLAPLRASGSLNSLRISSSPKADLSVLASGFSNLTSLDLTGNLLTNASFLTNLGQLSSLRLDHNLLSDLSPIASLPNLRFLYLEQNLLSNAAPLTLLTNLAALDVRLNLLDLSNGSPASAAIHTLEGRQTWVDSLPQRAPPTVTVPTQWFVAANATSTLPVLISDNSAYPPVFNIGVNSANPNLLSNQNITVTSGVSPVWFLTVTPRSGQTGNSLLTVTATNEAGLSSKASFQLTVLFSQPITIPDPNLQSAILTWLNMPPGSLTTVELLDLTSLDLSGRGVTNLSGLGSATNLTSLALDNNAITDLTPLSPLTSLSWLSASNNLIANISPLSGLSNLSFLNLAQNPITNYTAFRSGFSALNALDLSGNALTNVSFLTNLVSLSTLNLDREQLWDASPLQALVNLTSLSLAGNLLTNVGFITNLVRLTSLDLSTNLLSDISPLGTLNHLDELSLQQNRVTEITVLKQLNSAGYINLAYNELGLGLASSNLAVIGTLQTSGVSVDFMPQFPVDTDRDGLPDEWEVADGLNPADPADALLDMDGDGLSNLIEYALGTDPRNPGDARTPMSVSLVTDGINRYLAFSFKRRKAVTRLSYLPEVTGDNIKWYSDATHVLEVGTNTVDSQFDLVTVVDLLPFTNSVPRGFRLRVTRN
jgi:internalin A